MTPADLLAIEARRERAFEEVATLSGRRNVLLSAHLGDESEAILMTALTDSEALAGALRKAWAREAPASLVDALNSGDGTYRP